MDGAYSSVNDDASRMLVNITTVAVLQVASLEYCVALFGTQILLTGAKDQTLAEMRAAKRSVKQGCG